MNTWCSRIADTTSIKLFQLFAAFPLFTSPYTFQSEEIGILLKIRDKRVQTEKKCRKCSWKRHIYFLPTVANIAYNAIYN